MAISIVENINCMIAMQKFPDKFFDLAIVDPPYGIGEDGKKNHSRSKLAESKKYTPKKWDNNPPDKKYFDELFRVSKNQIIFGANHFIENINRNSSCWIVWDKDNGNNDFADCELAWTSFTSAARIFKFRWSGMLQGDMKNKQKRIHPTEKPVKLYEWILKNYAKSEFKILDTHLGSGSSRIAAHNLSFDFWGYEIDAEYFCDQQSRFNESFNTTLFDPF
jgi:site-specific DNA-methyltransferase (adenine-specific)